MAHPATRGERIHRLCAHDDMLRILTDQTDIRIGAGKKNRDPYCCCRLIGCLRKLQALVPIEIGLRIHY